MTVFLLFSSKRTGFLFVLMQLCAFVIASNTVFSQDASPRKSLIEFPAKAIRGSELVLKAPATILIGEIHGTHETPLYVASLVRSAVQVDIPTILCVEMSSSQQASLSQFLKSEGTAADVAAMLQRSHWSNQDGRGSAGMLSMIELMRQLNEQGHDVRVRAIDIDLKFSGTGNDQLPEDIENMKKQADKRDETMANGVLAARKAFPKSNIIVLTGNVHAKIRKGARWDADYVPMCWYVAQQQPQTISLSVQTAGGQAWSMTEKGGGPIPWKGKDRGREAFVELFDQPRNGCHGVFYVGEITASKPAYSRMAALASMAQAVLAFGGPDNLSTQPVSVQEEAIPLAGKIRKLAEAYVDGKAINSAVIGVVDGEADFVLGVGQLSREDARTPDRNTVFEIGSVSKVFTGILLADAIERGIVKSGQQADDLLPEGVSMPIFLKKPDRKITLADLSTHVSGLPRQPGNLDVTAASPYAKYSADDLYEFLKSHELEREPGTVDEYSNLGVGLLGVLLSRKQNTDYESLIRKRIVEPLQMTDTTITLSKDQSNRLAPPHDGSRSPSVNWDFDAIAGAGAIRSTAGDMLKFVRASLNPPDGDTGKAIQFAFERQRKSKGRGSLAMGFGWMINGGSKTHWHNGGTAGYHSIVFVNRKQRRALVVLSNTSTPEIDRLGSEVMALLNGQDVQPRKFRKTIDASPKVCARYVGRYKLNKAMMFDIAYANDEKTLLTVQLTGQPAFPIFPESETLWFLKLIAAEIEFAVDGNGECTALTLIQGGLKQTAAKQ